MKKIILLAACILSFSASAQVDRHKIRISYGIGQDHHFNNIRNDMEEYSLLEVLALPILWLKNFNATLNLEYFYNFNQHIAVGGMAGGILNGKFTQTIQGETYAGEELTTRNRETKLTGHALYFIPAAKWTWYRNKVVSIYSKAGFGMRKYVLDVESNYYPEQHENKWKTAFQASPIGVEVGWRHVKFYNEYGFGHQGYVQAGLAFLF